MKFIKFKFKKKKKLIREFSGGGGDASREFKRPQQSNQIFADLKFFNCLCIFAPNLTRNAKDKQRFGGKKKKKICDELSFRDRPSQKYFLFGPKIKKYK